MGEVVRLRRNAVTVLLPHSLESELARQNTPVKAAQWGGTGAGVFRLRIAPGRGPMRKGTRQPCTNPARLERVAIIRTLLLAALLVSPSASESQGPPQRPPSSSPSIGATAEMPADEIFSRFAARILFLTCDLSADDLKQASGVLISADGFLVTNAHVVEGCRSMAATLIDRTSRRSYEAALKYYDKKSDTAVLKIEGKGLDFFDLFTRTVRVGERIYAIGNPRGLEQSISEGIVSGLRREDDGTSWIQHSAPISPGSSGGALISSRGELLGINSWFLKESQGLNFAVPTATLASAYSDARTLQGFLKFPGSPPNPAPPTPSTIGVPPKTTLPPVSSPQPNLGGGGFTQSVRLNVTVTDKSGHRITNLPESAFTVMEDGTPQEIRLFKVGDVPVAEGIVIDNSSHMRDKRSEVEVAALALVKDSNPQDEVFVVNFNEEAFNDLPHGKDFTSDIKEMEDALTRIDSRGGAAVRDAIRMSIDHEKDKAHRDKKVLVVVTGGNDNSSLVSLANLAKASQQSDVIIYAIGLLGKEGRHEAQSSKQALEALAEATGGEAFFPKDLVEVGYIAHQVAHDIRNQYTIEYSPSNRAMDGTFRRINVMVKGPGSPVARTRQGYYAVKNPM